MSNPVSEIEEMFNPDLKGIRKVWPGAEALPLEELPDKIFE